MRRDGNVFLPVAHYYLFGLRPPLKDVEREHLFHWSEPLAPFDRIHSAASFNSKPLFELLIKYRKINTFDVDLIANTNKTELVCQLSDPFISLVASFAPKKNDC